MEERLRDIEFQTQVTQHQGANPDHVYELIAEVRRLREALRRYGWHETGPDGCLVEPCTCGLSDVLEGK